jgi:acetyl-CoA C-acetyltransferase
MNRVVIVSAKRTPIGIFMKCLSSVNATDLGAIAIKSALEEISLDPNEVDEVFMSHVLQSGTGQVPARQASLNAGIVATLMHALIKYNKKHGATVICNRGLGATSMIFKNDI